MIKISTNKGNITLTLFEDKAPNTCANFKQYVADQHFNGTIFHRVIPNFMIQGGGLDESMQPVNTRDPILNEADNGLSNTIGTVAMARTMDPHSASCQFFINTRDNTFLDFKAKDQQNWGYCVFGKVIEGIEVVKAIEAVPTTSRLGHQDVPVENVVIEKIEIIDQQETASP